MVILAGFWGTPIFLPLSAFSGKLEALLYLNPIAGIIVNSRAAILYGEHINYQLLIWDITYAFILWGLSIFFFKRFSHKAAEKM